MDASARGYEHFEGRIDPFTSRSRPWWPSPRRAPHGAPNVVVILVDDLGFSDLGAFGSEIDTPHIDALAERGWLFSNYHTAPLCSPSRAALLTGLNPHRAGFGFVAHVDPGYPGFTCELPEQAPTLAESLRAGGYATFMVGKWHLTVESKLHDGADRSSWPLQRGFDHYFGSMDGFTSLHHPHRLVHDNSVVEREGFEPGYFLTDELTDRALGMIDDLRANDAERPFFLYYAHTAVHGPIQAKPVDIAKYRGRYQAGWDALRRERFSRQQETGVLPPQAQLPDGEAADERIPDWDELSPADRELFARHMEAYAAAVDEVDQSVGRLLSRLDELGERENTLIVIASDNGGTAEGGMEGTRSYFAQFGVDTPLPADWVADVPRDPDLIGGPQLFSHYPAGWARVSNTPFRSYKSSVYEGGVHAPLVMSWPAAPGGDPGHRRQFVFVSDLAPTILDLVGVPALSSRAGVEAMPVDGQSVAPVLRGDDSPGRLRQYFECAARRALYEGGHKIVSPVPPTPDDGPAGGVWELYDLNADPTETEDLAGARPELVRDLARRWEYEAWRNTVFPLADDDAMSVNRPDREAALSRPVTLTPMRPPLERFRSAKLTVLRSFRVRAHVQTGPTTAGVIVAHGDQGGGYLLAIEEGCLHLAYNAYGRMHRDRSTPLADGEHEIVLSVDEQADLRWSLSVAVDGGERARLDAVPMLLGMAPFTGISVGYDYGGPVDWQLHERHGVFRFHGGTLDCVRYEPGRRSSFDRVHLQAMGRAVAAVAD